MPLTYASLWAHMRAGKFPRSRQAGKKVVWLEHEVNEWIYGLPLQKLKGDPDPQAAE